ncbi:hypothetical protein J2Y58_001715 [Sphingomonas sp. BE138]|uniref:hypothetical protein n=1 Tax=Sphingomonas sp. BE138 TaxID=2817845 RepID=UPI00285ABE3F|nr:hypothetical protein [Sphingomonas sp. BE138]MDR6788357.1 hypothetical protein [Sphingomonas sp. BE138]
MAQSTDGASPYKQRIEAIKSDGPPERARREMVNNVSCLHDTQKANNCTVFYDWQGSTLKVYGLGSHVGGSGAGNSKYGGLWYTGKKFSYNRGK